MAQKSGIGARRPIIPRSTNAENFTDAFKSSLKARFSSEEERPVSRPPAVCAFAAVARLHKGHSPSSKVCRFWIANGKFGGLGSRSGKFHPVDVTPTETEP